MAKKRKSKKAPKLTARQAEYLREYKLYQRRLKDLEKRLDIRGFDIESAPAFKDVGEMKAKGERVTQAKIEQIRKLRRQELLKAVTIKKRDVEGLPPIAEVAYNRFVELIENYDFIDIIMKELLDKIKNALDQMLHYSRLNKDGVVGQGIIDINALALWVELVEMCETREEYYQVPYKVTARLVPRLKKICADLKITYDFTDLEKIVNDYGDVYEEAE